MTVADVVLTTFNARYVHTSLGLRCLKANLGPYEARAQILEFDLDARPVDVVERILALEPVVVGLGAYVWNRRLITDVATLLARIAPEVTRVVGGPEIDRDPPDPRLTSACDHLIRGEGEGALRQIVAAALDGGPRPPALIVASALDLTTLAAPYRWYSDEDLRHRIIYAESTRGCPMRCSYCRSARDGRPRPFPLRGFLEEMARLHDRGCRRFKLVDRSFNADPTRAREILRFFEARAYAGDEGAFELHLEWAPQIESSSLIDALAAFPEGALHVEVGVQTLDPAVAARVGRPQRPEQVLAQIARLRRETGARLHLDLIAGLPGEDLAGLAAGFDALVALAPHELQLGVLKRLPGTPLDARADELDLIHAAYAPYEVLATDRLSFHELQRIKRFARYWEVLANRGSFPRALPLIWGTGSPFERFMGWADWLYERTGRTHQLSLQALTARLFDWLVSARGLEPAAVAAALAEDYQAGGRRRGIPEVLRPYVEARA
jgi:radical SAM superfamily enzyme YgiQ (UPF0313 family)